jgi:hypothetical protein
MPRPSSPARVRITTGLRQAADYLESHPAVPISEYGWDLLAFPARGTPDSAARAEVRRVAAVLGVRAGTDGPGGYYRAVRDFGPVTYRFVHVPASRRAARGAQPASVDAASSGPGMPGEELPG